MQKIRIIVESEIDEKTMQDCGCNTTDILNGLLICDSYEAEQAYAAVIIHRTSF